jgi:hypothetical protein
MKFKMKKVKGMPKSGQFIGVWCYNGVIWSDTYKWEGRFLKEYNNQEDDWVHAKDFAGEVEVNWFIMVVDED